MQIRATVVVAFLGLFLAACDDGGDPESIGACCNLDGACSVSTQDACEANGDDFQGHLTSCSPNPCDQPETVACCSPGGSCLEIAEADCENISMGSDSTCDPNPCDQPPMVACCTGGGVCQVVEEAACSGVNLGPGSTCDQNPCCTRDSNCSAGSYCDSSGVCLEGCRLDPDDCQNGYCDEATRTCMPFIACCDVGGCEDTAPGDCLGVPLGESSSCAADTCPFLSACCMDGACYVTDQASCTGTFVNLIAVGCEPNPCCLVDDDCSADSYCEQACVQGCRTQPDSCADGYCDPATRTCVPMTACCAADGTCVDMEVVACAGHAIGDGTTCADSTCPVFEGSCLVDDDCEVGACNPASGQCVYAARYQFLVDALRQWMAQRNVQGMAVAVLEGGEVTFATGLGVKESGGTAWVRPTTLFRIASVTKSQTAVALLQLVEDGLLDLDAPVTDYLPGFHFDMDSAWAPSITARHLLTHATGMEDYLEVTHSTMLHDGALAEFLFGDFSAIGLLMAPSGRFYNYSNPNYYLAGLLVEALSGSTYRDYMRDRVWQPLGMQRTSLLPEEVLADGDYVVSTTPYNPWEGYALEPDTYDNGWARPCGYAFSSALDLAEFVKFLRNGNPAVLSDTLRDAMKSPQRNTEEVLDLLHHGFGLFVTEGMFIENRFYDIRLVDHGGYLPGYFTWVFWVPELDLAYITLTTDYVWDGFEVFWYEGIFLDVLQNLATLPEPVPEPDLSVDPATYGFYGGEYYDPYRAGCITVYEAGNTLRMSISGFDDAGINYAPVIYPIAPHNFYFYWNGSETWMTFILDGNGQPEYLRTRWFVAEKVASCSTARKGRVLPALDADALRERVTTHRPRPRLALPPRLRNQLGSTPRKRGLTGKGVRP